MKMFVNAPVILTFILCIQFSQAREEKGTLHPKFKKYWYSQGAEISKYALQQSRYGEIHSGNAVLVFVTETINPELQVKADSPTDKDIPILKLNATRKFNTGIYPYTTMTSIFTPVASKMPVFPSLKVTTSVQEWCGHVWIQLNQKDNEYKVESRSYFESESDQNFKLPNAILEDGLWTQIRLSPNTLPTGIISVIPGTIITRFTHKPLQPAQVEATLVKTLEKTPEGKLLNQYTLHYPTADRTLKIFFEREFPHRIEKWEESYRGLSDKVLTTKAVRTHTLMKSYWNYHKNKDRELLKSLNLKPF